MANTFDDVSNFDAVPNVDNIGANNMSVVKYIAFINNRQVLQQISTSQLNNDANYTIMGNVFNGAGQLVQLDVNSKLPAVDGSQLTGITPTQVGLGNVPNVDATNASNISSGTLANARLTAQVTLQGNTFNGNSELVQTNASGQLPALDGSQLTSLHATQIGNGTITDLQFEQLAGISTNVTIQTQINNLSTSIIDETLRAESVENSLQSQINDITGGSGTSLSGIAAALSAEVLRATSVEGTLSTAISVEQARATSVEGTLSTAISVEQARATSVENALSTAIIDETLRAESAEAATLSSAEAYTDTKISALIDSAPAILDTLGKIASAINSDETIVGALTSTVASNLTDAEAYTDAKVSAEAAARTAAISTEQARATSVENTLSTAISTEQARATSVENTLSTAITDETLRAESVENALSTAITSTTSTLSTAISVEQARATSVENTLSTAISVEQARATSVENILSTAITDETLRAESVENSLQSQINSIDTTIIDLNSATLVAYENLAAGAMVNIFADPDDLGTIKVRNANATDTTKPSMGFVLQGFNAGQTARVYYEGTNNQFTGLTVGTLYYLDTTNGQVSATAPIASGNIIQVIGMAVNTTTINCSERDYVYVA